MMERFEVGLDEFRGAFQPLLKAGLTARLDRSPLFSPSPPFLGETDLFPSDVEGNLELSNMEYLFASVRFLPCKWSIFHKP